MEINLSPKVLRKMIAARLKKLASIGPFVEGSFVIGNRRCGNPKCKCATGEQHPAYRLSFYNGPHKTKTVYIPVDKAEEVKEWVGNYKKLKKLIKEISDLNVRLVRTHIPIKKNQKRSLAKKRQK